VILRDFLVENKYGYYCQYGDFYIDPKYPVKKAVISHAHGDHAVPGHSEIYSTEATVLFMQARYARKMQGTAAFIKTYKERFQIGEVEITFLPAGHILGSAQILMQYKGVKYLYTGDYKLTPDVTCEAIESVKAEVLITETTFANPAVSHPDPREEIQKIREQKAKILLGCYSLGKAQSITALINHYCPEIEVYIHRNMEALHRIYQKQGRADLKYRPYRRREFKEGSRNKVYLVPPMTFQNYYRATDIIRAFASGWDRLQEKNGITLYISDHADWEQIVQYIREVKPEEIWTVHGNGKPLHDYFHTTLQVRGLDKIG